LWEAKINSGNRNVIETIADKIRKLERKLKVLRNKPDKGALGRKRVIVLNQLSYLIRRSDPNRAEKYAKQALTLAEKLYFKRGIASSYDVLGTSYWERGDYDTALQHYNKALHLMENYGSKRDITIVKSNVALVYAQQGEYAKSLDYLLECLKYIKKGDKKQLRFSYGNIASCYAMLGHYDRALEYYIKSIPILESISDKTGLGTCYSNIGFAYERQGHIDKALECFLKSLRIAEDIGDKSGLAISYHNIGYIYYKQGDFDKALEHYIKSARIRKNRGDEHGMAIECNQIGDAYAAQGSFNKAIEYHNRAVKICGKIGAKRDLAESYHSIADVERRRHHYRKALKYLSEALSIFKEIDDSYGTAKCHVDIGLVQKRMKNYSSSISHLYRGLNIAHSSRISEIELLAYERCYELYRTKKDYRKALTAYTKHTELKNKLFNAEKSNQIADMQAKYETERKEKEREIYRLKNVELRKEIKQRHKIEKELNDHREHLKKLVAERTSKLEKEIANRKKVEQSLLINQKQLRSLAREISLIEEKQRRKFATFLHDDINQALALATFKLRSVQETKPGKNTRKELSEIKKIIDKTAERTRTLAFEISPPILYELGFVPALEWLVRKFGEQYKIKYKCKDDGVPTPLTDDASVFLFQSARELLSNVAKHAQAQSVKVSTVRAGTSIRITVEDDGRGFNPRILEKKAKKNEGFGLFNVRERLRHLRGQMEVQSTKGKGTTVILTAPLKRTARKKARKRAR